jgi:hypothetical protein
VTRRPNDFYETAPWQVDALVDNLPELSGTIWCPCVGDGSLMRRLAALRPDLRFVTNDIDRTKVADFYEDAATADGWNQMLAGARGLSRPPDWVVENFPFNVEHRIVPYAFDAARCGVVAMARVSYAEPTKDRGPWLSAHPYQKRITLERHSFTGNGSTDSATTDWLVWAKVPISPPFGISAFGYRSGQRRERLGADFAEILSVGEGR